jgi:hypothetical protein
VNYRIVLCVVSFSLFFGFAAGVRAVDAPEPKTATLRIPKLLKAPVIDGTIDPKEWQGAAAVTGFPNLNQEMSLPQELQPIWYLGYDDKNLYLAFRYPVFPKGTLRAACKSKAKAEGQQDILWDDHTEIEICNTGREKAVSGYFYKFMTNPWDVVSDQKVRWSIGQLGYEYDTGTVVKSSFDKDYWDQEIAIPLKDLGTASIEDGARWVMQIVSAQDSGGNYYTWVPATWLAFHKFPEVIFDSQAAAVQFNGVGDWMEGNPDFSFKLFNPQHRDIGLHLAVKVVGPQSKVLLDQNKIVNLKPGQSDEQHIKGSALALGGEGSNHVYLKVTDDSGAIYYENEMTLWNSQSRDVHRYIDNLAVARKPVQPKLQFAFMPSFKKLNVYADIGILGIDPKFSEKAKFLSASFASQDGTVLGKNTISFAVDGTATSQFGFSTLADGTYRIEMEIQDADGKPLLSKKDTFEQKAFPFQSFKGGIEETIVKPYTPIQTTDQSYETVGNHVDLTANGLPAAIHSKLVPAEALPEILAGPVTLVATQYGRATRLASPQIPFAWNHTDIPTKVTGTAQSQLDGLTLKVNGRGDYTGQYLVDMDIVPNGKVDLDRLELEIPVSDPVDTCYAYSPRDSVVLYKKDRPWTGNPKEGEIWNNLSDRATSPYIMYVGDGERGLYWYTDSYEGFWLDRNKPHIMVEKRKDSTVLRVAFFNKPVTIDHARHIRFSIMAVPTKPLPPDAREMQWDGGRMHIGGASWWGTIGCFVFPFNDQQWQDWIAGKPFIYNGKPYPGQCALLPAPPKDANGKWLLQKGHEYGSYRAADIIGYLQPELKVFAGEWTGVSNPEPNPDASLLGYEDEHKNSVWPLPEQRSIFGKDACIPSFYDYEAYYFYLMAKNTGAGGYWWDWGSMVEGNSMEKGTMYLNDEGHAEPRTNIYMVRDFYERIARIVQDLGIPDTNNCYAPGAVYQMPWLTRINAWESLYLESDLDDMFDAWGVDRYRMQIGKYSGIPVQNVMNVNVDFTNARARTIIALALLHDNGVCGADGDRKGMAILKKAGIFDEAGKWIPYWRSSKIAVASQPGLLITGYQLDGGKRLTLVIVNSGPTDITTDITAPAGPGGKAIDAESDAVLSDHGNQIPNVTIKHHDFRLLTLE